MSEKKYPTDKQIQKILSCYGEYSELPIYNPSDTGPIDTNIYEKDIKIQQLEARLAVYEQPESNIIPAKTMKSTLNESQKQSVEIFAKNIEQDRQDKISKRKPAGRPNKLTESEIQIIYELNKNGYSLREIASQMNCSKSTVDNYLKKSKRKGIPE